MGMRTATPDKLMVRSIQLYGDGRREPQPPPCPSIFPFGHYRGHRMWQVAQDTLYTDKLLRQPWFRAGYPVIADILARLRAEHANKQIDGGCVLYRPRFR